MLSHSLAWRIWPSLLSASIALLVVYKNTIGLIKGQDMVTIWITALTEALNVNAALLCSCMHFNKAQLEMWSVWNSKLFRQKIFPSKKLFVCMIKLLLLWMLQCKLTSSLFSIIHKRVGRMLTLPMATLARAHVRVCVCVLGISRHAETARRQSAAHVERGRDPAPRKPRFDQSGRRTIILASSAHQQFN